MYNRYVPQGDGSFRRNAIPDPPLHSHPKQTCDPDIRKPPSSSDGQPSNSGVGSFFRQLIPKDFCTEDLLIVLLLLLMSGDRKEDQNFALLTLALYLFL